MKTMKKTLSLVLAIVMALALAMPAMAVDNGHTISVKDTDTHTYKVFQVLTGTLSEAGSKQLGNPAWGADATDAAKATDVNDFIDSITAENLSDQDIAQLVAANVDTDGNGRGEISKDHPLTGLATGYYVLVDVTQIAADEDTGKIDTKAMHVVQVLNDIKGIDIKWGTTESDKEIVSDTLGNGEDPVNVNADVDNVSIGDTVNFKIEATIPENADDYNYFYFVISDKLDPGLTLNQDSIVVYKTSVSTANALKIATATDAASNDYQVRFGSATDSYTFQVGLNDAKAHAGEKIIVTYSAVLNENATIGEVPNENTSKVIFSNDPNHDYNGDKENPKPGFPDQTDLTATGETPESKTETYTTGIELQKVDENGDVLTGAEFTITGNSTEIVLVSSETFTEAEEGTTGEYYGLKDGTYTKQAPVNEDYMKEAATGATKGYVLAENDYAGTDKITVGGKDYRPVKEADITAGTQIYVLVKANADDYNGKTYNKTISYTQKDTTGQNKVDAKVEVGADGVLRFVGLGAGEYTITETKTPAGYNTIDPIKVKIAFTANPETDKDHWTKDSTGATYNATTGLFEMTVENQKGTELPSTGGIGTKMFYTMGAVLVIGAGVVLVSRKRAGE